MVPVVTWKYSHVEIGQVREGDNWVIEKQPRGKSETLWAQKLWEHREHREQREILKTRVRDKEKACTINGVRCTLEEK